jgi:hypothetical protein
VGLSPEPGYDTAEQLARGAQAVVERGRHRYSNNCRPAPTLAIHQNWPGAAGAPNRTVSPFENLAAAHCPLITTSRTTAPANDL